MRRWVGLALASAVLLGAYHQLELPFALLGAVALVPWLCALEGARGLSAALGRTWLTVSVAMLLSFPWLVPAAELYARLPTWAGWPLLALGAPLLQPQFFVAAAVRHQLGSTPTGRLAAACGWVITEQLAPKLLHDTLGLGLTPLPGFRAIAALGTAALLTLLLLGANEWVALRCAGGARRGALAAGAAVLLTAVIGFVPYAARAGQGAELTISAVQASLPRYDTLLGEKGSEGLVDAVLSSHEALSREAPADLVVWGETVYPTTFGHPKSEAGSAADARISTLARELGRPILFGGYDRDERSATEFNAAFLVDGQGRQADVYRKSQLFPFGEFIPFGEALVRLGWLEGPTGWGRGPGPRALSVPLASGRTIRVQPLICYEAVFPELTDLDAELIVNLSNDGGFGSELEARQDLAIAALRSIETGRPQVRVANSGTSALIDGSGAVVASLPVGARGVLRGTLRPDSGRRALPGWWLAVLGLVAVAISRVPRLVVRQA